MPSRPACKQPNFPLDQIQWAGSCRLDENDLAIDVNVDPQKDPTLKPSRLQPVILPNL